MKKRTQTFSGFALDADHTVAACADHTWNVSGRGALENHFLRRQIWATLFEQQETAEGVIFVTLIYRVYSLHSDISVTTIDWLSCTRIFKEKSGRLAF